MTGLRGCDIWTSLVAQLVKNSPEMRETWVWSLGWKDPSKKEKATHSSILAWRIPWVHGSQRAKTWKQPKCRPADGWFKKMWYIHTMEYYSAIKINETLPSAATWMNLENIILSKISQTEEDIIYHLYVESKKLYKWIYIQNKHRLTDIENKSTQRGRGGWIN